MAGLTKALVFSVFLGALMACEGAAHKLGPLSHVVVEKADDTVELTLSVEADLLFVVDGSGSMANHQKRVMENLKLFLDELGRAQYLNYRVGVTIAGCARSTRFRQYQARTCYEGVLHSEAGGPGPYYVDRSDH